jgi:glucosylceramidase
MRSRFNSEHESSLRTRLRWLARILLACMWITSAFGQEVKVYVSSRAGARLALKPPVWFVNQQSTDGPLFRIMTGDMFQRIAGFGATFQEAGMICLNSLSRTTKDSVLRSLFDPRQGAGFSAMNVPIAATSFSSAGPRYSYDEMPGDVGMRHFSIQRDLAPNGLISYIGLARRYGQFVLQAFTDYPPDWMLIEVDKYRDVEPKYYDALARYYVRYVQDYERYGIFINYVSLPNERPPAGAAEVRELLKNRVGPLFETANLQTGIMFGDSSDPGSAFKDYAAVLNDPQARQYVSALGFHGYGSSQCSANFSQIAALHKHYPDLPLLVSETSCAHRAIAPPATSLPRYSFEEGAFWGNTIVSELNAGASGWIYGNMVLDQHGGPWLASSVRGEPGPNPQQPVVVVNRKTAEVYYTGLYYYLAHFSKFLRPGALRVEMDGSYPGLRGVAFLSPELEGGWHWVVELINERQTDAPVQVDFELDWLRRSLRLTLPAISITTCVWRPLPDTLGNMPAK